MPVFLPRRWNRQPPYNAGVDWNSPLTQNIRNLWNMSQRGMVDAVGNANGTPIGGVGLAGSSDGLASTFDSAGTTYINLPRPAQFNLASGSRWTLLFRIATTTDVGAALWHYGDGTADNRCAMFIGPVAGAFTDELITWARIVAGGQTPLIGFTTATRTLLFDGAWHTVMITSNGSACAIWVDGISRTVTAAIGTTNNGRIDITGTAATATLGAQNIGTIGAKFNGSMSLGAFWARDMSQFAMELHQRPWQLFSPAANQTFYSLPSQGASTQTLTDVGNIASAEAFGTAALALGAVTVAGVGAIASAEAFGDAVVSAGGTLLSAVGNIASTEAFGTATLVPGAVSITSAGAISSAEAFGTSTLSVGATLVTGVGNIASGETFGAALITSGGAVVTGAGNIASGETFGSSTVAPGAVSVTNAGAIASGEVFGTAALARGAVTLSSAGAIASGEAFGDPLIAGAGVFIQSAGGIASGEAFGPVPLIPQAYVAPDVRALEVLGGGRILEVAGGRRTLEVQG